MTTLVTGGAGFCYVTEMTGALIRFMETGAALTGPINFGKPIEHTILELAEIIIRLCGQRELA